MLFGFWKLEFLWGLGFGIWNFIQYVSVSVTIAL